MVDKINMDVNNFALIDRAEFEIENITIIQNMDGFGSSDINKLLFCLLLTLSCEGFYAANKMIKSEFFSAIHDLKQKPSSLESDFNNFVNNGWDDYNVSRKYLDSKFEEYKNLLKKHNVSVDTSIIEEALKTFDEFKRYRSPIFQHFLDVEFKNYSIEKYSDYEVNISVDNYPNFIKKENNQINIGLSYETPELEGNILYLGPRTIFEFNNLSNNMPYHYEELFSNMTQTHIVCEKDVDDIIVEIVEFITGYFSFGVSGFEFHTNDGEDVDVSIITREVKQFGVILFLLQNNAIPESSIMILDRIDKDMCELYQNKLAKILVELAKRLGLILLINTDSDIFCDAINDYQEVIPIKTYEAFKKDSDDKYSFK